jgi:hypothetical protein
MFDFIKRKRANGNLEVALAVLLFGRGDLKDAF